MHRFSSTDNSIANRETNKLNSQDLRLAKFFLLKTEQECFRLKLPPPTVYNTNLTITRQANVLDHFGQKQLLGPVHVNCCYEVKFLLFS